MKLSIVIPSCLRPDLLAACLASVRRCAPAGAEVIVVDDASPSNCVGDAASRFDDVRVLRLARRSGFCTAVNAGIHAARGDIVELLNDDTEVMPGWADAILPWFRNPAVGAVAPLVLLGPAGDCIDSAGDRYYVGGVCAKRGHGQSVALAPRKPMPVFGASASCAFYRRRALLEVGGFPEEFKAYFEDVDVAFRLQRAGWRTMFEPGSRVLHHGTASYGPPRRQLLEQQSLNEERVFWRNLPCKDLAWALPAHAAVLLAKSWRRWREGALWPFLRGRLQLFQELPAILRHRRRMAKLGPELSLEDWEVEKRYWFTNSA